jgi:hypothetical protein
MLAYTTSFTLNNTPQEVFNAINNVHAWWGPIEGHSQKAGDEFFHRHGDVHYSKHQVTEMVPDKKVVWLTIDSRLNFVQQKDEWNGTKIVFEVSEKDGWTTLTFTQEGLTPALECYGSCSEAWGFYVGESLRDLIVKGEGHPDR